MPISCICVLVGWLLVFMAASMKGRSAGLWIGSVFGGALAFLVMPPLFSFQITEPGDGVTLAAYAVGGLAILHGRGRKRTQYSIAPAPVQFKSAPGVALSAAIEDVLRSDLGRQLRARHIEVAWTALPRVPGDRSAAVKVLSTLFLAALDYPDVCRIDISAGPQPGREHIWLSAQRTPPALNHPITIGRTDSEAPLSGESWPGFCRASRFDNGSETTYRLTYQW